MGTKTYDKEQIRAVLEKGDGSDIGSMNVTVRVELGELNMTVEQAAQLLPGRVLNLGRSIDTVVCLRVGEKQIASGHLVDCEGAMAVEIKEVL